MLDGNWKEIGLFVGGLVFGTVGIKALTTPEAKTAYTHATAAGLRAKEEVMTTAQTVRENCEDIYADAVQINEKKAAKKAAKALVIEDVEE